MKIDTLITSDLSPFKELISVFQQVFEMPNTDLPKDNHLSRLLSDDGFLVLVALEGEKVVGGLTLYLLPQYYEEFPVGYIYDVGVLPEYQRKGVGRKLLEKALQHSGEKGCREIFVQADKEDTHALEFYRSCGASIESEVVHFTF